MKTEKINQLIETEFPTRFNDVEVEILYERDDEADASPDDLENIGWLVSTGQVEGELDCGDYCIRWLRKDLNDLSVNS